MNRNGTEKISQSAIEKSDDESAGIPLAKWPQMLADMLDVIGADLAKRKKFHDDAAEISRLVVMALSQYYGGRSFYIPQGVTIRKALRDNEIWRKSRHMTVDDIAAELRVSVQLVYAVIKEQRALRNKRLA